MLRQTQQSCVIVSTSTPNAHISGVTERYGLQLFVNEGAPGIAHDWNCAVEHATTPLVTIAHQDDTYESTYVEELLHAADATNRPLIFFADYGEIRDGVRITDVPMLRVKRLMLHPLENPRRWKSIKMRRRILSFGSPICCPSVAYVPANLPSPLFNEGMRGGLDWDAWERFSRLEGEFMYCPRVLMHHRIHEASETSAIIGDATRFNEDLAMFERFWPRPIAHALNRLYALSEKSNSLH